MNDSFVYKWTNTITGKWYIGSHKGTTDDGYRHSSEIMKLAEAKHGVENFTREILFEGNHEKDKIKSKEAKYLNKYDAANNPMSYNRTNITGPNCFSKETREKKSIAMKGNTNRTGTVSYWKGKKQSRESNRKRSESLTGHTMSEASKMKLSNSKKGKKLGPHSAEANRRQSISMTGEPRICNYKPLLINNIIYSSRLEAQKLNNVSRQTIHNWLKSGKAKCLKQGDKNVRHTDP